MEKSEICGESKSDNWVSIVLLLATFLIITVVQTQYVGDRTIYAEKASERRIMRHTAILENTPPTGGWQADGANANNIRILPVYLAETIRKYTPLNILQAYKLMDVVSVFATIGLLYFFLRYWRSDPYALVAVLFFGAILPVTYAFHAFHPWDRMGLLFWLAALWAARENRVVLFGALVLVGVTIRFDAIVLPGLYFLAHATLKNLLVVTSRTSLLSILALGLFFGLIALFPGGFEDRGDIVHRVAKNMRVFSELKISHPFFLGFGLPIALAAIGFAKADRFSRVSAIYGVILFIPHFLATNFVEIRAQMGIMVMLFPAAIAGLHTLLDGKVVTVPDR